METVKENQNKILELKINKNLKLNSVHKFNCRLETVKGRVSEPENWSLEIIQLSNRKKSD